jgi:hypothetical protein
MKVLCIFYVSILIFISNTICSKLSNSNYNTKILTHTKSCPLPTCQVGQQKVDNQVEVKTNGCGPEATSFPLEVINDMGNSLGSDFKECCNEHDKCYGTCGTNKKDCDKVFYECMNSRCSKKKKIYQPWCKLKAKSFYTLVDNGSVCFFNDSQINHCKCV